MIEYLPLRFQSKIAVVGDCWEWTGYRNAAGYGEAGDFPTLRRGKQKAHRLVYELLVGPIPEGLTIDHLCRNRACVIPSTWSP